MNGNFAKPGDLLGGKENEPRILAYKEYQNHFSKVMPFFSHTSFRAAKNYLQLWEADLQFFKIFYFCTSDWKSNEVWALSHV